jgi:hypothetical protein
MSTETRKMKRKNQTNKKKLAEREMATKIALFGKLPDHCLTCEVPFDKMNKEQVTTWSVVVRKDPEAVRLYCPTCWAKALEITKDFKKHLEEKYDEFKS